MLDPEGKVRDDDNVRFCVSCGAIELIAHHVQGNMYECCCQACGFLFVILANDCVKLPGGVK